MAGNQTKSESTLIKKVGDIANVMAAAGVGFTDYITQLTYILFLKMDEEKEEMGLSSSIPDGYKWKDLVDLNGTDLIDKYEEILKELAKEDGLIGTIFTKASNKIDSPVKLAKIIDMVKGENWYMMEGDAPSMNQYLKRTDRTKRAVPDNISPLVRSLKPWLM